MANEIEHWLGELGLAKYVAAFKEHEVSLHDLPFLTDDDLKTLGLPLGPRRRLLAAAAGLAKPGAGDTPDKPAMRPPAERRQLTVLFSDLVGSTELSGRFDPEEMSAIIRAYHNAVAREIRRFEGHIARFMGDGVLAYFGYPKAHEDDAERAVRAGLGLVDAVGKVTIPGGETLIARVGIATGDVVVGELIGEGAAQENAVVGETPNLAARLQTRAGPGTVVIAANTQRLLGGLFEFVDLAPQRLKGFAEPLGAYRVKGKSRGEDRFEALRGHRLTPLVGREHELELLLDRFERAQEGEGQVVLLGGEPGIGKSRIVHALRGRLARQVYTPLSGYCSPYHTNSALYPVIGLLERAAGFERADPPAVALAKIEALLALGTRELHEAVPLIAELLGIPIGKNYQPVKLTPERQKQRTLEVLVEQVAGLARKQPVLAICEDAQWIDPTTLDLFGLLIERVQKLPVLFLITHRPEFDGHWQNYPHVMHLSLTRLAPGQAAAMVEQITQGKALPSEIVDQILARTDGVPLFVEELTATVLKSGRLQDLGGHYERVGPLVPIPIPSTLHDSLMARLDRLAAVKEVAQIAAVIGRVFSREQLAAISGFSEQHLTIALDQLVESGLIFRRGAPPDATYTFKHALVQDAAYQSLLRATRRNYHAQIARLLEERFPDIAQPELLAHHYTEAGNPEQALRYWHQAGRSARRRSANAEAIGHFTRGLEIVSQLPDTPQRAEREIDFQISLGPAYIAMKGHGAPEVAATYNRARELGEAIGDPRRLSRALAGLSAYYTARGPYTTAYEMAEQALVLAERCDEPRLLLTAQTNLGVNAFLLGRFATAQNHLDQGMALAVTQPRGESSSQDFGLTCRSYSAVTLFSLGYPDQALERSRQAVQLARDLEQPYVLAFALYIGSYVHKYRREPEAMLAYAEEAVALCTGHNFALWLGGARVQRGWALVALGRVEEGAAEIRRGLTAWLATGAEVARPYFLALLADAELRMGRCADGLRRLDEGLSVAAKLSDRFYEAELYRLRGELMLHRGEGANRCKNIEVKAEGAYRKALAVARDQSAKSWELRAAMSLVRLLQQQNRKEEARAVLTPIYEWFTEGLDTRDLSEARALLEISLSL
jgi:class 3 adenylate cyclase/predicted ATPase